MVMLNGIRLVGTPSLVALRRAIRALFAADFPAALAAVDADMVAQGEPSLPLPAPDPAADSKAYRLAFVTDIDTIEVFPTLVILTMNQHVTDGAQQPGAARWAVDLELHLWARGTTEDPDGSQLTETIERYGAAMYHVLAGATPQQLPRRVQVDLDTVDIGYSPPAGETMDVRAVGLRCDLIFRT